MEILKTIGAGAALIMAWGIAIIFILWLALAAYNLFKIYRDAFKNRP